MTKIKGFFLFLLTIAVIAGCNKVSYRKTKNGLAYKLFPGSGKDSLIKDGQVVKFQVTTKLNDSVMYSSYGKMPAFIRVIGQDKPQYNLLAVFPLMRKGDSAVIVQMADSLIKAGIQLPGTPKKGDRIITCVRIVEVFKNDSLAMANYNAEVEKDRPRMMKEQAESMEKMKKQKSDQEAKEDMELERTGEIAKELKEMEAYLKRKNISAQKTGKGTFVVVQNQGTTPLATPGKYIHVKYSGKYMDTDTVFQANSYEFVLGEGQVIRGWDEGLQLFGTGGKGTLFVPGFLAYKKNPPQGSDFKPFEPLRFDIEVLSITDSPTVSRRN